MTTNGTELAERPAKSAALAVKGWLDQPTMHKALAGALTGYMAPEAFKSQCYIAAQDPNLKGCSPESLFKAFLECAQMGLLPGAHHRHVALVPRAGVVTVTPQWQGFKFLMERQPGIKRVRPVLVHSRDTFNIVNGLPVHHFDPFDDARVFVHPQPDPKKPTRQSGLRGGYLVIEREMGELEYHYVSAAKIERNRACAQTQNIWIKWFEEMCLKTVLRDAWSKRVISIDPELAVRVGRIEDTDNQVLGNDPSRVTTTIATGGSRTDRVAGMLAGGGAEDVPDMSRVPVTAPVVNEASDDGDDTPPDGPRGPGGLPVPTASADGEDHSAETEAYEASKSGGRSRAQAANDPRASCSEIRVEMDPIGPGADFTRDGRAWAQHLRESESAWSVAGAFHKRAQQFERCGVLAAREVQALEELSLRLPPRGDSPATFLAAYRERTTRARTKRTAVG